ncbi:hypothetical protein CDD82_1355 [Ophiocordyceps australis]|uniref:Uncharacterized protein n=1 Tax=Ophiocordyceps australis TaxID=1399860 RepID=A0A2C5XZF1_9HYPO|nr:hypothetical protein CDD82_1355 [Ophiocordyceps australis]
MPSPTEATRIRHGLHPLTTASTRSVAASPSSPPSTLFMTSPRLHLPASAIQPYNPQEWVSSSASTLAPELQSDQHGLSPPWQSRAAITDNPPSPSAPPPPYSPPRTRRQRPVSTAFEHAIVPAPPSTDSHSNSPFPPPPTTSTPSSLALPTLSRRWDQAQPETQQPLPNMRRSMAPAATQRESTRIRSPISGLTLQTGPPAARRAASAGAVETPTSARSRSTSLTRWEPGMPLPPPPPGPPPVGSRSQSVQAAERTSAPAVSLPTRRPPPGGISSLGPVPPTPADWVDDGESATRAYASRSSTLSPGTVVVGDTTPSPPAFSPGASGLSRARAIRHDKTIIQRRAESRNRTSNEVEAAPRRISDIVVPVGSNLRGPGSNGSTQRANESGEPSTSKRSDSRNPTPRAQVSARRLRLETAATPPFSPCPLRESQISSSSQSVAAEALSKPQALPTPPPQGRNSSSFASHDGAGPRSMPVITTPVLRNQLTHQSPEEFAAVTVERFKAFATKEASAPTDADRVRIFAEFFVNESRIRRERYSSAIGAMGSEIFDLTRDLFRPMGEDMAPSALPGLCLEAKDLASGRLCRSAPASANISSHSGQGGPMTSNNLNWASNYMPSLSPILSMSVSENYESGSSRGRPSSRWWESDSHGNSCSILERSRRESKYMGVSKDQWAGHEETMASCRAPAREHEALSDYPPEKTGWHQDEDADSKTPSAVAVMSCPRPQPPSPKAKSLNVSRLITLPPPYPRHHPAVNNSHPELATTRNLVRALSDLTDIKEAKDAFVLDSSKRRDDYCKAASERQQALRANLQNEVEAGNLGYADAAVIESDSQDQERERRKEFEKREYEQFQNLVIMALNQRLTERISQATEVFDKLVQHLIDDGQMDADLPQEEGDDRPELLEKLTLLKWIFETRETLHRAIYELISDRNSRYCEVVMAPYRMAGNNAKVESAEAFFIDDAARREHDYAKEALERTVAFQSVVEEAVEGGVALQLSAFWDIAPPLRQLLEGIPANLTGFGIDIPAAEMEENPSYNKHPLQYLYSLLQHAEKSTYQFIEAHTNLLCLLHEVKEAVVNAQARVVATESGAGAGENGAGRAQEMRVSEGRRLTEDLKEKVRVVQDQWLGALGDDVGQVKERIGAWLLQQDGWDEALEEPAVDEAIMTGAL